MTTSRSRLELAGLGDHREPPALGGGEGESLAQRPLIVVLAV
jgi:hypothetical protein